MEIRKFKPLFNDVTDVDKGLYAEINTFIQLLDGISRLTHQCVYMIDYYKKEVIYAYDNPLFLEKCDNDNSKLTHIPFSTNPFSNSDEDIINIYTKSWFEFLDNLPINDRKSYLFQIGRAHV